MKSDLFFPFENAGWPTLLVEESGRIRAANATALAQFGPVVQGENSLLSGLLVSENNPSAEDSLLRKNHSDGVPARVKFRSKGGEAVLFDTHISAFTKDAQKFIVLQLFKDASGAASDGGAASKQKLDTALQLVRSISLDLNNALTSVLGHTTLVLSKLDPNHPSRASLLEVEKAAEKAAEITDDLAGFSRQEKETRAPIAANLNEVAQRTVETFRAANRANLTWSLQLERKLFSASFDEAKMQQAFAKIIDNAIESIAGDGRVTVQTRNLELSESTQDRTAKLAAGTYVCVEISDTGSGVEAEVLPKIFEPFFTTKNKTRHRGLGLAWVYGIITNHGGGVAVSSQAGHGTSVRVYLPAHKTLVKDVAMEIADFSGTQTILFVDDEESLLTMGQIVLSSYGYKVLTANNGKKAIEIFNSSETPIDLVITDLVMPNMGGRELTEQIRRLSPHTRVMSTSGYVRANNAAENDAYLQKPFTSQELLRKVKQMLMAGS